MGIVNNVQLKDVVSMLKFLNDSGGDVIGRSSGGGRVQPQEKETLLLEEGSGGGSDRSAQERRFGGRVQLHVKVVLEEEVRLLEAKDLQTEHQDVLKLR
jgi:hypothetical protein